MAKMFSLGKTVGDINAEPQINVLMLIHRNFSSYIYSLNSMKHKIIFTVVYFNPLPHRDAF